MPEEGESNLLRGRLTVRTATKHDLDDLIRIHVDGFTDEPATIYCYPFRDQYPGDYRDWTEKQYANYLEQREKYLVHVVETRSKSGSKVTAKPAGLAVWNLAVVIKDNGKDEGHKEARDANKKHCEAFSEMAGKRFTETYFAKYGKEQINLSVLVVHPDFRRRGAGTLLVNWGIEAAEDKGWPVTLCASPMGQLLYEHLKFKKIATEIVRAEDEEETLANVVMVLKRKS